MNDLKLFVEKINAKCKISLSVYDKKGNLLIGEDKDAKLTKEIKGVVRENDKTCFEFNFLNEVFVGVLRGIGEVIDGFVFFITELSARYLPTIMPKSKEEFYKELVCGKLSYLSAIRYADRFNLKEKKCAVLILLQEKGDSDDVVDVATNYLENEDDCAFKYDKKRTIIVKFISENNKEYRTTIEYAEFLAQTIYEETGINVKVSIGGTVSRFIDIEKSFLEALSVFTMESTIAERGKVRSFREFVIVKALDELPTHKKEEYLNLLFNDCNKEIFYDEVLCATAEEFFESNLNVSMASRKTFLHRNTLTYRLDKIQRETGLDLRRYNDAVTFRLITVLNKLLGK